MNNKLLQYPPSDFKRQFDIASPFTGQVIALSALEDVLIKNVFFGPGAAVSSTSNTVMAPFDGVVLTVCPLDYSIEVKSSAGLKCRIKYGNDTQHLYGAQFSCSFKPGDKFSIKQPLFTINSAWLKQQGVANICIMTVLNAQALQGVMPTQRRHVEAGEDTLFSLYL